MVFRGGVGFKLCAYSGDFTATRDGDRVARWATQPERPGCLDRLLVAALNRAGVAVHRQTVGLRAGGSLVKPYRLRLFGLSALAPVLENAVLDD